MHFPNQFVNKLRYAKEGAKDIMDRACADLPWFVWLEVDGKDITMPKVNIMHDWLHIFLSKLHVLTFNFSIRMLRALLFSTLVATWEV